MDFVMVSRPEKMFFRHKQVHGNFYWVFLFLVDFSTYVEKKTLARGNLGTQEVGRLISIAGTGRENSHENVLFTVYLLWSASTSDMGHHTWGARRGGCLVW